MSGDTLGVMRRAAQDAEASGNVSRIRLLVENGVAFAAFSIRAHLKSHEQWFSAWLDAGRPASLDGITRSLAGMREGAIRGSQGMTDAELLELIGLPPIAAEQYLAAHCPGLGASKASFALACSGFGQLACFDVHMLRAYATAVEVSGFKPAAGNSPRNWLRYGYLLHCAYGDVLDSARLQWDYWLEHHGRGMVHTGLVEGIAR